MGFKNFVGSRFNLSLELQRYLIVQIFNPTTQLKKKRKADERRLKDQKEKEIKQNNKAARRERKEEQAKQKKSGMSRKTVTTIGVVQTVRPSSRRGPHSPQPVHAQPLKSILCGTPKRLAELQREREDLTTAKKESRDLASSFPCGGNNWLRGQERNTFRFSPKELERMKEKDKEVERFDNELDGKPNALYQESRVEQIGEELHYFVKSEDDFLSPSPIPPNAVMSPRTVLNGEVESSLSSLSISSSSNNATKSTTFMLNETKSCSLLNFGVSSATQIDVALEDILSTTDFLSHAVFGRRNYKANSSDNRSTTESSTLLEGPLQMMIAIIYLSLSISEFHSIREEEKNGYCLISEIKSNKCLDHFEFFDSSFVVSEPRISKHSKRGWEYFHDLSPRYDFKRLIGIGANGVVCQAIDKKSNAFVAIKKISHLFNDQITSKRFLREICLGSRLQSPQIIQYLDICEPKDPANFNDIYIVTELADTDLTTITFKDVSISEFQVKSIMYRLLLALYYLHSAGLIHRDVKPANILINKNCSIKLCDLGLTRQTLNHFAEKNDFRIQNSATFNSSIPDSSSSIITDAPGDYLSLAESTDVSSSPRDQNGSNHPFRDQHRFSFSEDNDGRINSAEPKSSMEHLPNMNIQQIELSTVEIPPRPPDTVESDFSESFELDTVSPPMNNFMVKDSSFIESVVTTPSTNSIACLSQTSLGKTASSEILRIQGTLGENSHQQIAISSSLNRNDRHNPNLKSIESGRNRVESVGFPRDKIKFKKPFKFEEFEVISKRGFHSKEEVDVTMSDVRELSPSLQGEKAGETEGVLGAEKIVETRVGKNNEVVSDPENYGVCKDSIHRNLTHCGMSSNRTLSDVKQDARRNNGESLFCVPLCLLSGRIGTRWYRAPELILLQPYYNEAVDVWSAGCVLGELLNRMSKPKQRSSMNIMFPGDTCFPMTANPEYCYDYRFHSSESNEQLNLIFDLIGTPSQNDLESIVNPAARFYTHSFQPREPKNLDEIFPDTSFEGKQLLRSMLIFDQRKRITVKEALAHPYFEDVRSSGKLIKAAEIVKLPFNDDDDEILSTEMIRKLILQEVRKFNPRAVDCDEQTKSVTKHVTNFNSMKNNRQMNENICSLSQAMETFAIDCVPNPIGTSNIKIDHSSNTLDPFNNYDFLEAKEVSSTYVVTLSVPDTPAASSHDIEDFNRLKSQAEFELPMLSASTSCTCLPRENYQSPSYRNLKSCFAKKVAKDSIDDKKLPKDLRFTDRPHSAPSGDSGTLRSILRNSNSSDSNGQELASGLTLPFSVRRSPRCLLRPEKSVGFYVADETIPNPRESPRLNNLLSSIEHSNAAPVPALKPNVSFRALSVPRDALSVRLDLQPLWLDASTSVGDKKCRETEIKSRTK